MNGNRAVLDSNIIIDASKGIISIKEIVDNYDFLFVPIISYIEVFGYNFSNNEEKIIIEDIIKNIPIVNLDMEIAKIAIDYRKLSKIKIPDALILATAKNLGATLLTRNIDDFKNLDITINVFVPNIII